MKQKILLLILLLLAGIPVMCDEAAPVPAVEQNEINQPQKTEPVEQQENVKILVIPPKWTDFCEIGYENAVYKDTHDIFNIFSFVKSERVKKNYWAERRVSFENYLKSCNALDDSAKASCYSELRNIEHQKNDLYRLKRNQLLYENNIQLDRR